MKKLLVGKLTLPECYFAMAVGDGARALSDMFVSDRYWWATSAQKCYERGLKLAASK